MFFVGGSYINMSRLFEIQWFSFLQNIFSNKTLLFKYVWTSTFMGLYGIWVEEENVGSFVFGPWGKTCLKRPNSKVGNFDNYVLNGENGTHTLIYFSYSHEKLWRYLNISNSNFYVKLKIHLGVMFFFGEEKKSKNM